VNLTLDFYRRNYIEGLFLSSGIIQSPDYTLEQLIEIARSLREDHAFGGYIHLKAIPGASPALIERAGTFADRLSANIELPTQQDLIQLAPEKNVGIIEGTMGQITDRKTALDEDRRRHRSTPRFAPAGQSTQMVVGATATSDRQILSTASHLYSSYKLRRIYYSSFSPFPLGDARLPQSAPPLVREHRLYQADWLMRYYGFSASELTTHQDPNLSLLKDPKLAWAEAHPEFFPVDVNAGLRDALLRVPGIGHRNVDRILRIRRYHRLGMEDLRKLNVRVNAAQCYIIAADHFPSGRRGRDRKFAIRPVQLELFAGASALSGQL
jgi:putative DNA modification/repair radical SAM protein